MELFHIMNRGVEKRTIFMNDKDRLRFIHNLFMFNDVDWVQNNVYAMKKALENKTHVIERKKRRLVDIHVFCLMPNHFHLLLSPLVEDGVAKFVHKISMGYAKYFNTKYERTGVLFQGSYRKVSVTDDSHFIHLPYYIHCNPLDLIAPEWRNNKIKDAHRALAFLQRYRWSSYLDYTGVRNFPEVTHRSFLTKYYGGKMNTRDAFISWIRELDFPSLESITLD